METKHTTSYSIEQVYLSGSFFHRDPQIEFENIEFGQEPIVDHVDLPADLEPNKFMVHVTVKIIGTVASKEVIKIEVTNTGVFHRTGESLLQEETFKKVNAPAIIYPFVREHIATVAVKAGIGSLLLPPVNFTNK